MIDKPSSFPQVFKGIALFSPGGDLIYGVNHHKQAQWHSDLCVEMQKLWGLSESPHFLVPGYTATVERWFNPQMQQIETIAEVYPPVERYIPLLQVLFDLDTTTKWQLAPWQEEHCNRAIIETYKSSFPQLWQKQNLIVRFDPNRHDSTLANSHDSDAIGSSLNDTAAVVDSNSYVLRLFIKSDSPHAEKTLSSIHQLLEQGLDSPYTLKVIDVSQNPHQAESDQVSVTPTLIRVSPQPTKRIVGELHDIQKVLKIITGF